MMTSSSTSKALPGCESVYCGIETACHPGLPDQAEAGGFFCLCTHKNNRSEAIITINQPCPRIVVDTFQYKTGHDEDDPPADSFAGHYGNTNTSSSNNNNNNKRLLFGAHETAIGLTPTTASKSANDTNGSIAETTHTNPNFIIDDMTNYVAYWITISFVIVIAMTVLVVVCYLLFKRSRKQVSNNSSDCGDEENTAAAAFVRWRKSRRMNDQLNAADELENGRNTSSSPPAIDEEQLCSIVIGNRKEMVLDPGRFMVSNPGYDKGEQQQQQSASRPLPYTLIPTECVDLDEVIGQGQYGDVYRGFFNRKLFNEMMKSNCKSNRSLISSLTTTAAAKDQKEEEDRQVVAIKKLKPDNVELEVAQRDFLREAVYMSSFAHSNITQLIGVVFNIDPRIGHSLVFEYMLYGDLQTVLLSSFSPDFDFRNFEKKRYKIVEDCFVYIALQTVKGLTYLEKHKFVHRDVAPRNILLGPLFGSILTDAMDEDGLYLLLPGLFGVKLADFGMARQICRGDYMKIGGTEPKPIRSMAPESILEGKYSSMSDVWMFGMAIWQMLNKGLQPYRNLTFPQIQHLIGGCMPPRPMPEYGSNKELNQLIDVMKSCWKKDPKERPTFAQLEEQLQQIYDDTVQTMISTDGDRQ